MIVSPFDVHVCVGAYLGEQKLNDINTPAIDGPVQRRVTLRVCGVDVRAESERRVRRWHAQKCTFNAQKCTFNIPPLKRGKEVDIFS